MILYHQCTPTLREEFTHVVNLATALQQNHLHQLSSMHLCILPNITRQHLEGKKNYLSQEHTAARQHETEEQQSHEDLPSLCNSGKKCDGVAKSSLKSNSKATDRNHNSNF